MLLSIANLKHHVTAAERGRYALQNIALTERGTVSSNGRELLFVPYPTVDPKDVPVIPGVDASSTPKAFPVLINPEDARRAAAIVPKRHINPVYHYIQAAFIGDKVVLAGTDGATVQKIDVTPDDGQYPDFVSVLPDYSRSKPIAVELDNLFKAVKTLREASGEKFVAIRFLDKEKAINLSTKDGIALLIMPTDVAGIPDGFETLKQKPKPQRVQKPKKPDQPGLVPEPTADAA